MKDIKLIIIVWPISNFQFPCFAFDFCHCGWLWLWILWGANFLIFSNYFSSGITWRDTLSTRDSTIIPLEAARSRDGTLYIERVPPDPIACDLTRIHGPLSRSGRSVCQRGLSDTSGVWWPNWSFFSNFVMWCRQGLIVSLWCFHILVTGTICRPSWRYIPPRKTALWNARWRVRSGKWKNWVGDIVHMTILFFLSAMVLVVLHDLGSGSSNADLPFCM